MNKYTFVYEHDNRVRVNVEAENVTAAYLQLQYKIECEYDNGVCLPHSSHWNITYEGGVQNG